MAEERNLATVRAPEITDEDTTKEELQRRMEEARESISQTVTEIKDTVANQYQAVRETVTEALDWREQFRKRPVAFSVGSLSVGFLVGYCIAGAVKGDGGGRPYYDDEDTEDSGLRVTGAAGNYYRDEAASAPASSRSYAAQAITGSSSGYSAGAPQQRAASAYTPPPSAYSAQETIEETSAEPQGPGLLERFKSTKAYDRLEEEVASLGDRFINELSKTAQTVVLPALFSKVKELFGVDLSDKEGGAASSSTSQPRSTSSTGSSSASSAALSGAAQSSFAGVNRGTAGLEDDSTLSGRAASEGEAGNQASSGGSSYATSENRGYGATAGGDNRGGSD